MAHHSDLTYEFVQSALSVGVVEAVDVAMLAGTYAVRISAVRKRLAKAPGKWSSALSGKLHHLPSDDTVGRFLLLQTPWNAHMRSEGDAWAEGLKELAAAHDPASAVKIARRLQNLKGAGRYQLGEIMHLLRPEWFAIVNKYSKKFWQSQGYETGGVRSLEEISKHYRDILAERGQDFRIIDELFAE